MKLTKHLRGSGIKFCTVIMIIPLVSGCSIASRASDKGHTDQPALPVIQDVYERSVQKEVYSPGGRRTERLNIPEPSLEPQNLLRDAPQ